MGKRHMRGFARAYEKRFQKRKVARKDLNLCCQINPRFKCSYCDATVCSTHFVSGMNPSAPGKKKYCPVPQPRPVMVTREWDAEKKRFVMKRKPGEPSLPQNLHRWYPV